MFNQEDRGLTLQAGYNLRHPCRFLRPGAGHGFIQQQQTGLCRQCQPQFKQPPFPMRQIGCLDRAALSQPDPCQHRHCRLPQPVIGCGRPDHPEGIILPRYHRHRGVVCGREIHQNRGDLKRPANPLADTLMRRQPGDILTLQQDAPTIRGKTAVNLADKRGLARAVRPDEGVDFPRLNRQVNRTGRHQRTKGFLQPLQFQ